MQLYIFLMIWLMGSCWKFASGLWERTSYCGDSLMRVAKAEMPLSTEFLSNLSYEALTFGTVRVVITTAFMFLYGLVGGAVGCFHILMILVTVDCVIGVYYAKKDGTYSADRYMDTIKKVVVYFIYVAVIKKLDTSFADAGAAVYVGDVMFWKWAIAFFCAREVLSIKDSLSRTGITLPPALVKNIVKVAEKEDESATEGRTDDERKG